MLKEINKVRRNNLMLCGLIVLTLIGLLSSLAYAGFGFGRVSVIKERVKKLDKKIEVEEKETEEEKVNHAPNTPGNPSPSNGATNQSINAGLSWTGGDPDTGDTVKYDVYFGTINPPTTLVSNDQSVTTYKPGTLSYGTTYYWKIIATDNYGASTSGIVWSFTIRTQSSGQWHQINGPYGEGVISIVIDPINTQTIYARTNSKGGLFKSTNGGSSWNKINTGLTDTYIRSIDIDPINTQVIYAAAINDYVGGIFKSTNGGDSWGIISGSGRKWVYSLAINPINSQVVYAGVNGGILKSTNGGDSWKYIETAYPIISLAIDPINPQIVYAGLVTTGSSYYGVLKSTNGGGSWDVMSIGLPHDISVGRIVIDPINTQTIYITVSGGTYGGGAGLFKSTNGGGRWSEMNTGLISTSPAIDPINTQTIYVGIKDRGIFKSTNGGGSWGEMNAGSIGTNVYAIVIDPINTQTIYAVTGDGKILKWW